MNDTLKTAVAFGSGFFVFMLIVAAGSLWHWSIFVTMPLFIGLAIYAFELKLRDE